MTDTGSDNSALENRSEHARCANCGAALEGEYCAQCGQSRQSIERSFLALAGEALGDILQWDGRFLTTFRQLFTRPGRVARDYADGKRQSYTPPVRLYLVVSLIFFALIAFSGIRVLGADITVDPETGPSVNVTMFQPPRTAPPVPVSAEDQAEIIRMAQDAGVSDRYIAVVNRAISAPEALEQQAAAAASQAMILMVIIFAVLSGIFHPRRRLIEHAIHALYYHAAILLPLAGVLAIGTRLSLPNTPIGFLNGALSVQDAVLLSMAVITLVASFASVILYDRGFYRSSWLGASLRSIPIVIGYFTASVAVSLGLIVLSAL